MIPISKFVLLKYKVILIFKFNIIQKKTKTFLKENKIKQEFGKMSKEEHK